MIDIRLVREHTEKAKAALEKRGEGTGILDNILKIENERRDLLRIVEEMRQRRNQISQEIGRLKKDG